MGALRDVNFHSGLSLHRLHNILNHEALLA